MFLRADSSVFVEGNASILHEFNTIDYSILFLFPEIELVSSLLVFEKTPLNTTLETKPRARVIADAVVRPDNTYRL